MSYIAFGRDELLNNSQLSLFLDTNPVKQSTILYNVLMEYLVISKNELYLYNKSTILYTKITHELKTYLKTIMRKFILDSYDNISIHDQLRITKSYNTTFHKLTYYEEFIEDVIIQLTNYEIEFNTNLEYDSHYLNGYYSSIYKEFFERDPNEHFITKYNKCNHEEPEEEEQPQEEDDDKSPETEEEELAFCQLMISKLDDLKFVKKLKK